MARADSQKHNQPSKDTKTGKTASPVVFISHASQDFAVATHLCDALERAGIACWIAPRNVRAGDNYASAIVQAINTAPIMGYSELCTLPMISIGTRPKRNLRSLLPYNLATHEIYDLLRSLLTPAGGEKRR